MLKFLFVLLVSVMALTYCSSTVIDETNPIVTVKDGALKGSTNNLLDGGKYFSFKGIPYAEPPIGDLRFRDPRPAKPWNGVHDATKHGSVCTQLDIETDKLIPGSEDCLFLNVYTKSLKSSSKLPVMVFVHGGAFISGSGDSDFYGPEFLLQHDVVVVTINYRLEVLGFLNLDTPEVPGNAGMKDQVAALKWIKNNIANFGGDPDNVTIFGESAGAAAVTYHLVSPMSKGLFHKVIAQSGTCIDDWAIERYSVERAFRAGKVLGQDCKSKVELLKLLRSVPAIDLAGMTFKTRTADEERADFAMFFNPVVEKRFKGVESFLNEEGLDILLKGKSNEVPLMIGYNSVEGLMLVLGDRIADKNNDTKFLVPREIRRKISETKSKDMGQRIKKFYVGKEDFSNDTIMPFVNMATDTNFIYNTNRLSAFHAASKKSVFTYRFSYDTDLNIAKIFSSVPSMKGATHADDLFYFFYNSENDGIYKNQKKIKEIIHNLTKMWTNFAKTGNPTPDKSLGVTWQSYNAAKQYMMLEEPPTMRANPDNDRLEFWNNLYCEAKVPCIHL
ncbi:juvenile hormone esterase-like [Amyelois transitella]|uniref:juvenile hormone esterase-like n=1 Tax=Amyelois transitella TaxID=680683 RepID=UPI00298F55E8|nr:juvenile hormone esterase-like [Amyelois transitella]